MPAAPDLLDRPLPATDLGRFLRCEREVFLDHNLGSTGSPSMPDPHWTSSVSELPLEVAQAVPARSRVHLLAHGASLEAGLARLPAALQPITVGVFAAQFVVTRPFPFHTGLALLARTRDDALVPLLRAPSASALGAAQVEASLLLLAVAASPIRALAGLHPALEAWVRVGGPSDEGFDYRVEILPESALTQLHKRCVRVLLGREAGQLARDRTYCELRCSHLGGHCAGARELERVEAEDW